MGSFYSRGGKGKGKEARVREPMSQRSISYVVWKRQMYDLSKVYTVMKGTMDLSLIKYRYLLTSV